MGLKDFFTRSSTRAPTTGMIVGRLYGNTIFPTGVLSASNAMTNSDIYSAVSLISSDVASMQFTSDSNVVNVLNKPHKFINSFNFWQSVVAQMLLYGNAYVTINKSPDGNTLLGLELLQDYQVSSITVEDGSTDITYDVKYDDNRPETYYSSSEMLHFKLITVGSDENNRFFGSSPLLSLVPELSIQGLSNELTKATLKNGINPGVAIKVPEAQLDKAAKDNIRDGFIDSTTGENSGKPIVLDASTDLDILGISPEVASFLENVNWTKTQISKAFGINEAMLNGDGDSQSSIQMVQEQYQKSLMRYKNAIQYEIALKLDTNVNLASVPTDDVILTRYQNLVSNQIVSPEDANSELKKKGII